MIFPVQGSTATTSELRSIRTFKRLMFNYFTNFPLCAGRIVHLYIILYKLSKILMYHLVFVYAFPVGKIAKKKSKGVRSC